MSSCQLRIAFTDVTNTDCFSNVESHAVALGCDFREITETENIKDGCSRWYRRRLKESLEVRCKVYTCIEKRSG